jgi:hypothetical protein
MLDTTWQSGSSKAAQLANPTLTSIGLENLTSE